jgi:hypothetical protein
MPHSAEGWFVETAQLARMQRAEVAAQQVERGNADSPTARS